MWFINGVSPTNTCRLSPFQGVWGNQHGATNIGQTNMGQPNIAIPPMR